MFCSPSAPSRDTNPEVGQRPSVTNTNVFMRRCLVISACKTHIYNFNTCDAGAVNMVTMIAVSTTGTLMRMKISDQIN